MSDPFATPDRAAAGSGGPPAAHSPRDDAGGRLREVVNALNEVATARKNEAVALQQQLDQLTAAYTTACRESDAHAAEAREARQEVARLQGELRAAREQLAEYVLKGGAAGAGAKAAGGDATAAAEAKKTPEAKPVDPAAARAARHAAELARRRTQHGVAPINIPRVAGLCLSLLLFLYSFTLGGVTETGTIPQHLALVGRGNPAAELVLEDVTEDPLFTAASQHLADIFPGGGIALLGELIEAGYDVQPPKTWRAVAAICAGLSDTFPDAARDATDAAELVAAQCWDCEVTVYEDEGVATWLLRTLLQVGFLGELAFLAYLVFQRVTHGTAAPAAPAPPAEVQEELRKALPLLMLPTDAARVPVKVWAARRGTGDACPPPAGTPSPAPPAADGDATPPSPKSPTLYNSSVTRWYEVTVQYDEKKVLDAAAAAAAEAADGRKEDAAAAPGVAGKPTLAAITEALLGAPVDLQTLVVGLDPDNAVRKVVFEQSHGGDQTPATDAPEGASKTVAGDALETSAGRAVVWVNTWNHLMAERNPHGGDGGVRYATVAPDAYELCFGGRGDAYAAHEGLFK